MDRDDILGQLKQERDRLDRAIEALEGRSSGSTKRTSSGRGGITAAGRKKLSEMMKKRWAERRKKAAKK